VEGPCPKLSIEAVGKRRFLVYGETGYDLHAWLPGDDVAAAQAVAEVKDGKVYFNPAISAGLPTDARGYVPGELWLGGDFEAGAWLLRTSTRYARGGTGALFERDAAGYSFTGSGWRRSADPVALPSAARQLPPVPEDVCPRVADRDLKLVPLAWEGTPGGGIVVAGRCDDADPANYGEPILMALHGLPGATRWSAMRVPDTDFLDGILNLDLDARSDDDVYLVAYEPFAEREERHRFVAHYDGERWQDLPWPIDDGLMSVARSADGTIYLAGGRALYRRAGDTTSRVQLPSLRYANASSEQLHVHTVKVLGGADLWVEASYRVNTPAAGGRRTSVWASALYSSAKPQAELYCDAREAAESAIYEVER
jgi:hypothetical protein